MRIIYDTETAEFGVLKLQPISIPKLNLVDDFTMPIEKDIWLHLSGKSKYLVVQLREVYMVSTPLVIAGEENDTAVLRPFWSSVRSDESQLPVKFDCKFTPEDGQKMWIVFLLHSGVAMAVASEDTVKSVADIYRIGFNNVFAEGNICTGHALVPDVSSIAQLGMPGFVNKWLQVWSESPFNRDLQYGYHARTLKFNPDTLENIKIGENWREVYEHHDGNSTEIKKLARILADITRS